MGLLGRIQSQNYCQNKKVWFCSRWGRLNRNVGTNSQKYTIFKIRKGIYTSLKHIIMSHSSSTWFRLAHLMENVGDNRSAVKITRNQMKYSRGWVNEKISLAWPFGRKKVKNNMNNMYGELFIMKTSELRRFCEDSIPNIFASKGSNKNKQSSLHRLQEEEFHAHHFASCAHHNHTLDLTKNNELSVLFSETRTTNE